MGLADQVAARPEDVGVDSDRLNALFERVERDVKDGTLPSASIAVAREGRLAGFRVFGSVSHDGNEAPAGEETLYTIFSSTKAIVSAAVWTLFEDGLLRLDEKVSDIIPEFGSNGKDVVTVEQAFLHIGGFPLAPMRPLEGLDPAARSRRFKQWRLTFEPGSQFFYHATSLHWTLIEIVERRTGIEWRRFLRERIIEPMDLEDMWIGLPAHLNPRVADVLHVVPPEPPPGGWGEVTPDAILNFNRPEVRAVGVPGGGGIARAAELALFYQPLINGGETASGRRIMKAETIDFATKVRTDGRHRDPLLGHEVNRALGVVVAGDRETMQFRGFGREASSRAFGHGGAGGQIGWGDPETGLSVGYCTNGFQSVESIGRRGVAVSSLASLCRA